MSLPIWKTADGKFKELAVEEHTKLEAKEQIEYLQAKSDFEKSERERLEKELKEKASGADVKAIESKIETLSNAHVKSVMEQNEALKKVQATPSEKKSFIDVLKDTVQEGVKKWKNSGGAKQVEVEFDVKAIDAGNFNGDIPQAFREMGINKTMKRGTVIRSLMFNGTATSDVIDWVEKVNETGNPIMLAECDAIPEVESQYQVFNTNVKKIGGLTKVSEEKLEDVEWIANEIRAELIERHDLVVESQLLSGNGTGNNLKGILDYATTFAAPTSFATEIPNANRTDVLRVAILQIRTAEHMPNAIVLHPADVAHMELEKSTEGVYIMPPFRSADGMMIKGLRVVETTAIPEGEFLVADFTKGGVFRKRAPRIEIGLDGNDFSTDKRTIKLTERLAFRIKGRDVQAFVKGDFDSAITAINKA